MLSNIEAKYVDGLLAEEVLHLRGLDDIATEAERRYVFTGDFADRGKIGERTGLVEPQEMEFLNRSGKRGGSGGRKIAMGVEDKIHVFAQTPAETLKVSENFAHVVVPWGCGCEIWKGHHKCAVASFDLSCPIADQCGHHSNFGARRTAKNLVDGHAGFLAEQIQKRHIEGGLGGGRGGQFHAEYFKA